MRLLDVRTLKLHTFYGNAVPRYTILSHTWLQDADEVTFQQIQKPRSCENMKGFRKIKLLCEQTQKDGFRYAWMDTCCIDKSNNSELSEAINSMFAWYQQSSICYAYLADIDGGREDFLNSRWWTRAWTLQELLAPELVLFFDSNWTELGPKSRVDLSQRISQKTGIDQDALEDPAYIFIMSVAQRMSWAASREATRSEDLAYALLGLFNINMPMLYGEGADAFIRLQKEILRTSRDQSLFAWSVTPRDVQDLLGEDRNGAETGYASSVESRDIGQYSSHGMFADHPAAFRACGTISFDPDHAPNSSMTEANGALFMEMPLVHMDLPEHPRSSIGLLSCQSTQHPEWAMGILLEETHAKQRYMRVQSASGYLTFCVKCPLASRAEVKSICIDGGGDVLEASYRRFSAPARTLCAYLDAPLEKLEISHIPGPGVVDLLAVDPLDLTCYLGCHWTTFIRLRITIVPSKPGLELRRDLYLLLECSQSEGQLLDQVSFYQPGDTSEMPHYATSSAIDLTREAKIEVAVSSRRIFNHIITDLKIVVRRYESSA